MGWAIAPAMWVVLSGCGGTGDAEKSPRGVPSKQQNGAVATTRAPRREGPPTDRPIVVPTGGYVGSASCQSCHAEQFNSWHASYHRTMTQVATPESVLGDFGDVTLTHFDHAFRLWREGDTFWVEMPDADFRGPNDARPRIKRQVVQITGSHHMQVYWYPTGQSRKLGQLPFVWLKEEARWIPRNAAFLRPPLAGPERETARWNTACIRCHTTGPRPRYLWADREDPTKGNPAHFDTHVAELGIACEACHGPAENHVAWHQLQKHQAEEENDDAGLVVPTQLDAERSSQVCGQCHSVWIWQSLEEHHQWSQDGFRYRPGDDLEEVDRFVVRPDANNSVIEKYLTRYDRDDRLWSDGMVRVSGREYNGLIYTPCFTHADESRRLSCFSCHQMHTEATEAKLADWTDDQLKPGMRTNHACTQCHQQYLDDDALAAHTHHLPDSSGSNCYNCHMSYTTYGLLKAIRSHTIDSPSVQKSLVTGRPNACNQCHLDQTMAWAGEHLNRWYGTDAPVLNDEQRSIAASILWGMKGDAGQRALMAWSFGWSDARAVSGTDWMTPYLAQLMADPYQAVRIIATRSMRKETGFEQLTYDPLASVEERARVIMTIVENNFVARPGERIRTTGKRLLINPQGQLNDTVFTRLVKIKRDNRRVWLAE